MVPKITSTEARLDRLSGKLSSLQAEIKRLAQLAELLATTDELPPQAQSSRIRQVPSNVKPALRLVARTQERTACA